MSERFDSWTNRQRVEALLTRERPDRVPVWSYAMGFSMVYTNTTIADAYRNPEVSLSAQRQTCQDFDWICFPVMSYAAFGAWEFGGEIRWPSGEFDMAPIVIRRPVDTPEDVRQLKAPEIKTAGIIPLQTRFNNLITRDRTENEPFKAICGAGGPFTRASNVAGTENLCRWLIKNTNAAHRLLRIVTDFLIDLAEYWKSILGTEGVLSWEADPASSNQLISPKQFETYALPYTKDLNQAILDMGYKHIFCHICGEQNLNLKHWAEIPFGAPGLLSFGHEVELERAAEFFPNDIIMGNLDPSVIQSSSPEEVYEAAKVVIEEGKRLGGRFIFSPGCELPPQTPLENIKMINQAVNDYGWYD